MPVDINGRCDPKFASVKDAFAKNFEDGLDIGASVAVTVDGESVVDLWGGDLVDAEGAQWQEDTIVNVWSTTKTMAATVMLMLADRGLLDFNEKVSTYWPEFAQNGKQNIQVRHIMSHSAGLSSVEEPIVFEDFCDHEKIINLLAAQAPWWEPGTQSGYHAITQGHLQNEIVRRIIGTTLGEFFREEVAQPLDADFHIGTSEEHLSRIGFLEPPETQPETDADPMSIAVRTLANPPLDALVPRKSAWRTAEIPAANGHGNARSVARIHSAIACGGEVDGVRLLSEDGCRKIFEQQTDGVDLALGYPVRFGMGFGLNTEAQPVSPNKNACYWGGWGGSLSQIDMDARMSFGYVMNRMRSGTVGDMRAASLLHQTYQSLAR
ncbi:MAG: serine hydrolase domain-containing protein [Pseudomonadales bacterium]